MPTIYVITPINVSSKQDQQECKEKKIAKKRNTHKQFNELMSHAKSPLQTHKIYNKTSHTSQAATARKKKQNKCIDLCAPQKDTTP